MTPKQEHEERLIRRYLAGEKLDRKDKRYAKLLVWKRQKKQERAMSELVRISEELGLYGSPSSVSETPTPDGSTGAAEDVSPSDARRMSASPGDQR